jgi:hypothetical protein
MASSTKRIVPRPGYKIVFVSSIRTKDGKVLYARNYGKRAFPIEVPA